MHIFFSGIGGTGIGPLAMIAHQAGYRVSGSDKRDSLYIKYLKNHGIKDIHIGQTDQNLKNINTSKPIDWYVYSSAVEKENPNHPELNYAKNNIKKVSKRDELLNHIIKDKDLKLLAVAGTHGKTTTTAMLVYLLKALKTPISYSVGAKIPFGEMGHYDPRSQHFALEADEFDHNFLSFEPFVSLISGIAYDHHEQYSTQEEYNQAFVNFFDKSSDIYIWQSDFDKLNIESTDKYKILDENDDNINQIKLTGLVNRKNAWLVINTVKDLLDENTIKLIDIMSNFPGVSRRMERLTKNLYSDYAHTVEKIAGAIDIAKEMSIINKQKLVIVYEPLTNRRMHYTGNQHRGIFDAIDNLYWVPSYLAREDPKQSILTPTQLIDLLSDEEKKIAKACDMNDTLKNLIKEHLEQGDMVVALSGGGGGSLDEWIRANFVKT